MEIHYGVIQAGKLSSLIIPADWGTIDWTNVERDNVPYKMMQYFNAAPAALTNQLDQSFTTEAAYRQWLAGTDAVPILTITQGLSTDKAWPAFKRTARVLSFTADMYRNTIGLTLAIQYYNDGGVEQKQAGKQLTIELAGAWGGVYLPQLNSTATLAEVLSNIIVQKDKELL